MVLPGPRAPVRSDGTARGPAPDYPVIQVGDVPLFVVRAKDKEQEEHTFLVDGTTPAWSGAQQIPEVRPLPSLTPLVCKDGRVVIHATSVRVGLSALAQSVTDDQQAFSPPNRPTVIRDVLPTSETCFRLVHYAWRTTQPERTTAFGVNGVPPITSEMLRALVAPLFTNLSPLSANVVSDKRVLARWELAEHGFVHILMMGLAANSLVYVIGIPWGVHGLTVVLRHLDHEFARQTFGHYRG